MVKPLRIVVLVILALSFGMAAKADHMENVNLTFQSGGTFTGVVDFSNDWSQLTGVNGMLTGYQSGTNGYVGSGSDFISWIWYPGSNYASGTNVFGSFLMDGTDYSHYWNWIAFTYDYTNAPNLVLAPHAPFFEGLAIEVDYSDPMVSASITNTPEPTSILLLGSGLAGLAGVLKRKLAARA